MSSVISSNSSKMSVNQGGLIPIRQKEQGFTGDKKTNLVLMRVVGGVLIFFAVIMSAIGVVYYTQPCCGPRWESLSEAKFKEQCIDRSIGEKISDTENSASDASCHSQSMVSLALWIASGVFVLIGATLLMVSLLQDRKDETEQYIDTVRDIGATSRIENAIARSDRKEQKKKLAKYEEKLQKKQDLELSRMESQHRRNSYSTGDRYFVQPSANYYGQNHQMQLIRSQQPFVQQYGNPSRIVYSGNPF